MPSRDAQPGRRFAAALLHRLFYPSRFALLVCAGFAVLALLLRPLADFGPRSGWGSGTGITLRDGPDGIVEKQWGRYEGDAHRWDMWSVALKVGVDRFPGRHVYTCETVTIFLTDLDEPTPSQPVKPGIPEPLRAAAADAMARQHDFDPILLDMIRTGQTTRTVRTPYWWLEIPARVLAPAVPALLCLLFLIRGVRRELVRRRLNRCRNGRCPACNFPTRDLAADRCPECGTVVLAACMKAERLIHCDRGEAEAIAQYAASPEDSPQMRHR